MENLLIKNYDLKENEKSSFYCYDCQIFTEISASFKGKNSSFSDTDIFCSICQSEFIERVHNPCAFTPGNVEQYTKTQKSTEKPSQDKNPTYKDPNSRPTDQPESRTIKKTIRLPHNSPFVRDVLIHAFPHVFRRANIERIQIIRNILNTLNFLNHEEESTTGPACRTYINSLNRYKYKDYDQLERFTNCPICTESFVKEDTVMSIDCGHTFHEDCLTPWLDLNNTCPNCRLVLPKRDG